MSDWNCPQDLRTDDVIWVKTIGRMRVNSVVDGIYGSWAHCAASGGSTFYLPLSSTTYVWKRDSVETLPCIVTASVIVSYGATCKVCNTSNEFAEAKADFVCFGCRS